MLLPINAWACVLHGAEDYFFRIHDCDDNGSLSLQEWRQVKTVYPDAELVLSFKAGSRAEFVRLDRNKNGKLEPADQDWRQLIRYGQYHPCICRSYPCGK